MFRTLRKAAASIEKSVETAFSSPPPSHTAFVGKTLTISGIKIKLGSVFAEGGYSLIHIATPVSSSSTNVRYAVKRISCSDPEARNQAQHEISFLRQLPQHPNIVKFYDAIFHSDYAFLLFELVDGGTLPERLKSSSLHPNHRLSIFADAVAAVTHLHAQDPPVAIRDVKLENLLFDRLQQCYKLCDFGSVTTEARRPISPKEILAVEEDIASNCSAMYRAPELVDLYSKQFICERVDVWALGCVWYAILFGTLPFDGQSSLQISKGLQHIPSQPSYPVEFIALLKGMLTVDPATRLDSFSVLQTVTRLQGKAVDDDLRGIGLELRRRRVQDFGQYISTESKASSATLDANLSSARITLPSADILSDSTPLSSSAEVRENPSITQQKVLPRLTKDAESWADFETAFGGTPSSSLGTASTRSTVSTKQMSSSALVSQESDNASIRTEPSLSLIDFSELRISQHRYGSSSAVDPRNPASIRAKTTTGTSAQSAADLIDFG